MIQPLFIAIRQDKVAACCHTVADLAACLWCVGRWQNVGVITRGMFHSASSVMLPMGQQSSPHASQPSSRSDCIQIDIDTVVLKEIISVMKMHKFETLYILVVYTYHAQKGSCNLCIRQCSFLV